MCAILTGTGGQFVEVYTKASEAGQWDAVASVYFIDTAANVVRYLETLNHALRVGGVWVNAGPLLWHMSPGRKEDGGQSGGGGVELMLDEVLALLPALGFELLEERRLGRQTYTGALPGAALLQHEYEPHMWVARKTRDVPRAPLA